MSVTLAGCDNSSHRDKPADSGTAATQHADSTPVEEAMPSVFVARPARQDIKPNQRKMLVVCWDGLMPMIYDLLARQHRLPNFSRLISEGAFGEVETLRPTWSPLIWTTIATGKSPDKHGILGFRRIGDDGRPYLYDSRYRKTNAYWNILSDYGVSNAMIGWWVTYPAEPIDGIMVSDRFVLNRFLLDPSGRPAPSLSKADRERLIFPLDMESTLHAYAIDPARDLKATDLRQFINDAHLELDGQIELNDPIDELQLVYAQDESHLRMTEHILKSPECPQVVTVYLEGSDIVGHYFLKYYRNSAWNKRFPEDKVPQSDVKRLNRVIQNYYAYLDRRLGDLLKLTDDDTFVVLISDHGMGLGKRLYRDSDGEQVEMTNISGIHPGVMRPPGTLLLHGRGIRPGTQIVDAHIYDITPTLLAMLGMPIAEDMNGWVIEEALDRSIIPAHVPEMIPTYDTRKWTAPKEAVRSAQDEAITRRLEETGYLGDDKDTDVIVDNHDKPSSAPTSTSSAPSSRPARSTNREVSVRRERVMQASTQPSSPQTP